MAHRVDQGTTERVAYGMYALSGAPGPSGLVDDRCGRAAGVVAGGAAGEHVVAFGDHLQRLGDAAVRQRRRGRQPDPDRQYRGLDGGVEIGGNAVWDECSPGSSTRSVSTTAPSIPRNSRPRWPPRSTRGTRHAGVVGASRGDGDGGERSGVVNSTAATDNVGGDGIRGAPVDDGTVHPAMRAVDDGVGDHPGRHDGNGGNRPTTTRCCQRRGRRRQCAFGPGVGDADSHTERRRCR